MRGGDVIHAIEPVGDGTGQVDPSEIEATDITVTLLQKFGTPDMNGDYGKKKKITLADDVIEDNFATDYPPPVLEEEYDAVIAIVGAPVPETLSYNHLGEISIEISVHGVQLAEAAVCPDCGGDLRETYDDGGCTRCGFYFDHEHLDDRRQAELDRIREEFDS